MMHADDLIERYVADVARLLPRRQRADVALELRTLLLDELQERAAAAGRAADEAMARELLVGFGRPAEVAARYRPTLAIIDPADSRGFVRAAVAGVTIIWVLGLVNALRRVLVVCFAAVAWIRRRWPHRAAGSPDRQNATRSTASAGRWRLASSSAPSSPGSCWQARSSRRCRPTSPSRRRSC
jgi:hypothetical protein